MSCSCGQLEAQSTNHWIIRIVRPWAVLLLVNIRMSRGGTIEKCKLMNSKSSISIKCSYVQTKNCSGLSNKAGWLVAEVSGMI